MNSLTSQQAVAVLTVLIASTAFHIFPPGYPQLGHIAVLLLMFPLFIRLRTVRLGRSEYLLLAFWLYACLVNITYWLIHQDLAFLVSILYWTYGLLLFFSFRQLMLIWPALGRAWPYALVIVMVVLAGALLFGGDRFYIDRRFVGTFSDPNQMGYWLLCAFVASVLTNIKPVWFHRYMVLLLFALIGLLAFVAGSRSTLIALVVLTIGLVTWFLGAFAGSAGAGHGGQRARSIWLRLLLLLVVTLMTLILLGYLLYQFNDAFNTAIHDFIRRMTTQSIEFQLYVRGYTRLIDFPQYLIFGAGQGYDGRFMAPVDGRIFEVHSSIIAPLFYYGLIGFGLLFSAFYLIARDRLATWQWFVFAAPFVYGLFTYGLRSPLFWLMLASLFTLDQNSKSKP